MKKVLGTIIVLVIIFSIGYGGNFFWTSANVKYYNKKGICPVCHESLVKYCFGTSSGPYFIWSCPKGCEDE